MNSSSIFRWFSEADISVALSYFWSKTARKRFQKTKKRLKKTMSVLIFATERHVW